MDDLEAKDEAVVLTKGLTGDGKSTEEMGATTDEEKME